MTNGEKSKNRAEAEIRFSYVKYHFSRLSVNTFNSGVYEKSKLNISSSSTFDTLFITHAAVS